MSTAGQNSEMQIDASYKEERKRIFEECASGVKSKRNRRERAVGFMHGGDTLVVWKSDRQTRSLRQL